MKSPRLKKDKNIKGNIMKDARNSFRLKNEIGDTTIEDISNIFRLKKRNRKHHG